MQFQSLGQEDPLEKGMPPVFLLGKFPGLRSLRSYGPWGHKKSDMMDQLMLSLSFFMYNSKLGAVYTFEFFLNMSIHTSFS